MKICLLCLRPSPDDAVTCPHDGEATWGPRVDEVVRDKAAPAADADEAPTPPREVRRTGKSRR